MKGKALILSALVITMAIFAAGTLGFFTAEKQTHHVITTGGVEIQVLEWADEERTRPFEDRTGVMPNTTLTKIAEVKNTGSAPAWVRVQLNVRICSPEKEQMDPTPVSLHMNFGPWQYSHGFYYYADILEPGEVTEPVFTAVTFDPAMGNEYQNGSAYVEVVAQAVQSDNNGENPLQAVGWPNG